MPHRPGRPPIFAALFLACITAPGAAGGLGAIRAFGLPHDAVGNAVVTVEADGVVISGIGASGLDGVRVTLGDADGWLGAVDFGPGGALTPRSHVRLATTFETGGAPGSAAITIEASAGGLAAVRLDEVGCACAVSVELRRDGRVVDGIELGPPPFGIIATGALGSGNGAAPTIRVERGAGAADRAFVIANPMAMPITLAGSTTMVADEIRVRLAGAPDAATMTHAVTVTAAGVDTVTIRDEALVQLGADVRTARDAQLELSGTVDGTGGGDVTGTEAGADPVTVAPVPGTPGPIVAVDLRLAFLTTWPDFIAFDRETEARFEDGSVGPLTSSTIDGSGACGCSYIGRVRGAGEDVDRTLVARLDGAIVGHAALMGNRAFVTDTSSRPASWSVELVADAPPGRIEYREVWRWDAPTPVTLYDGLGQVVLDEVSVTVAEDAGAAGAPVELVETVLGPWGFFQPTSFVIDGIVHRRPAPPCRLDVTGNRVVGLDDVELLLAQWGTCPACEVDFDGDGTVGTADLVELLAAWGACPD